MSTLTFTLHIYILNCFQYLSFFIWQIPLLSESNCVWVVNNVVKAAWRAVTLHYELIVRWMERRWNDLGARENTFSDFLKNLSSPYRAKHWFCFFSFTNFYPNLKHASTHSFTNQWADTSLMVDPFSCHTYTLTWSLLCKVCRGSTTRFSQCRKTELCQIV